MVCVLKNTHLGTLYFFFSKIMNFLFLCVFFFYKNSFEVNLVILNHVVNFVIYFVYG